LDDRFVFGRQHGAGAVEEPPSGGQHCKSGVQYLVLHPNEACDVFLPAQQLDIRVAADDTGCRARHIRQDAVKGPAIPKGRRVADIGHDERRLAG
jgi:hypothetical protein